MYWNNPTFKQYMVFLALKTIKGNLSNFEIKVAELLKNVILLEILHQICVTNGTDPQV